MYLFRHFLFVLAVLKWHWSFSTAASNENCHKAVYGKGCNSYIHMDNYNSYGVQGGSTTLEECAAAVKDLNGKDGCIGSHFFFEYAGYCNCPKDNCTLTAENMNAGGSGQLYSVEEGDCEQSGSNEYQYNDGCRSDICIDYYNDCCAPFGEPRGCALPGYTVYEGGTSSSCGLFGSDAVYQCCLSQPSSGITTNGLHGIIFAGMVAIMLI